MNALEWVEQVLKSEYPRQRVAVFYPQARELQSIMSWYFQHQSATSVVTQLLTTFSSGDLTMRILIWFNAGNWLPLLTAGLTPMFEIKSSPKVNWLENTMVWMVRSLSQALQACYHYLLMKRALCISSIQILPPVFSDKMEFKIQYTDINGRNRVRFLKMNWIATLQQLDFLSFCKTPFSWKMWPL